MGKEREGKGRIGGGKGSKRKECGEAERE